MRFGNVQMDCSSVQTGSLCPLKEKHKWAVESQGEAVYLFLICEIPIKSLKYFLYLCNMIVVVVVFQPDMAL